MTCLLVKAHLGVKASTCSTPCGWKAVVEIGFMNNNDMYEMLAILVHNIRKF